MRITKRPSLNKLQNKMSATMTDKLWKQEGKNIFKQQKELLTKLPPIRRKIKNVSTKIIELDARKQTQTTMSQSTMMFQSMYGGKDWLKPSDYAKEITQLNLLGEEKADQVKSYYINLTEKFQKNIQKYARFREVTEKWVQVLKKAMTYVTSRKASSDKLIQQIKFWKILSRKFDELQYQFNDQRATNLLTIMKKVLLTEPIYRKLLDDFIALKQDIIKLTPSIKTLYMQLEQVVSGFIIKFEQSSDICQSINLLKKILIGFEAIGEQNSMLKNRYCIIYDKIDQNITQKLLATSLYPRQLANISSVKENYQIIDKSLSFYSHFLNSLESCEQNQQQLIQKVQFTRQVLCNLLQILSYFQYLYAAKQVNQFSKLFSHPLNYNIYDQQNSEQWSRYMELVNKSMELHNFES